MHLVSIYKDFIFYLFLTFLVLLTFIFMVLRFKLALGHLRGRIEELYISEKTSWTC